MTKYVEFSVASFLAFFCTCTTPRPYLRRRSHPSISLIVLRAFAAYFQKVRVTNFSQIPASTKIGGQPCEE